MGKDGPDGFLPYAPLDQRLDEPQGLTYTTPALTEPLHLAGPSEFRFWAVTEGSDMAWVARLEDVAPDGSASLITQGWLRASFRYVDPKRSPAGDPYLPDDRDTPVVTGQTTEYRMDIWDTAYTLAPGPPAAPVAELVGRADPRAARRRRAQPDLPRLGVPVAADSRHRDAAARVCERAGILPARAGRAPHAQAP